MTLRMRIPAFKRSSAFGRCAVRTHHTKPTTKSGYVAALRQRAYSTILASRWFTQFVPVLLAAVLYLAAGPGVCFDLRDGAPAAFGDPRFGTTDLLFHHPAPPEILVQPFSGPSVPTAKDRVTGYSVMIRANDRSVRTALAQTALEDRCVLVAFRQCEFLFPFHSFW